MRKLAAPNSFGNYAVDAKPAPPYEAYPSPLDLALRIDPYWRGRMNLTPTQQAVYRQPNFAYTPFDAYTQYQKGREAAQGALKPDPRAAAAARYMNFSAGYAHHPATRSPYRTAEQIAEARSTGQSQFLTQAGLELPQLSDPLWSAWGYTPAYVTRNKLIDPDNRGPFQSVYPYTSPNGKMPAEVLRENKEGIYGVPTPVSVAAPSPWLNAGTARATLRSAGYNDYLDERAGEVAAQDPEAAYRLYRDRIRNNAEAYSRNIVGFESPYNSLTTAASNPDKYGVNLRNYRESPSDFYGAPRPMIPDPENYRRQNTYNAPYRHALYNTMYR